MREIECDLLIAGGGIGGCAAALAATDGRPDLRVILTEPTRWLGGQATQQGVPFDENPWVETVGATARYQRWRRLIRELYRAAYPLTPEARANGRLNPGGGFVSLLCCEPRVALAALESLLLPAESLGSLTILRRHEPARAEVEGDAVRAVEFRDLDSGERVLIRAAIVLDATETGDLLPLTNCEYVTGAESQAQTGEPHAPAAADPANMQAVTWCFAMDCPGGDRRIEKPARYDFWARYTPPVRPAWTGPLFSWTWPDPITHRPRRSRLEPGALAAGDPAAPTPLWSYRQIQDPRILEPAARPRAEIPGATLVNWPQTDYLGGNLFDTPDAARHWREAKEMALCFFYWLQTEAPRPDGGAGYPGLRLRGDLLGSEDGFALYPYIREARRIRARFTVTENHIGAQARGPERRGAEPFRDSVGIGYYRIDLHPTTGGDNYVDIECWPFQIPLGALLPARMRNLVAAGKCLGVTHITNGCYRPHPVEWNTGEAAGALAAECLATGEPPVAFLERPARLETLQSRLAAAGVPLAWPPSIARRE